MAFRQTSFWRNYAKGYLQYMAVGFAALPAGVLYAYLAARGHESGWTLSLAVGVGCLLAFPAWRFVAGKIGEPEKKKFSKFSSNTESEMQKVKVGDIVTTQAGSVVFITGIERAQTNSNGATTTWNDGTILSSNIGGYADAGADFSIETTKPLRFVIHVADLIRLLEERGLSFEPAVTPPTPMEVLQEQNKLLMERIAILEGTNTRTVTSAGGPFGPGSRNEN